MLVGSIWTGQVVHVSFHPSSQSPGELFNDVTHWCKSCVISIVVIVISTISNNKLHNCNYTCHHIKHIAPMTYKWKYLAFAYRVSQPSWNFDGKFLSLWNKRRRNYELLISVLRVLSNSNQLTNVLRKVLFKIQFSPTTRGGKKCKLRLFKRAFKLFIVKHYPSSSKAFFFWNKLWKQKQTPR